MGRECGRGGRGRRHGVVSWAWGARADVVGDAACLRRLAARARRCGEQTARLETQMGAGAGVGEGEGEGELGGW